MVFLWATVEGVRCPDSSASLHRSGWVPARPTRAELAYGPPSSTVAPSHAPAAAPRPPPDTLPVRRRCVLGRSGWREGPALLRLDPGRSRGPRHNRERRSHSVAPGNHRGPAEGGPAPARSGRPTMRAGRWTRPAGGGGKRGGQQWQYGVPWSRADTRRAPQPTAPDASLVVSGRAAALLTRAVSCCGARLVLLRSPIPRAGSRECGTGGEAGQQRSNRRQGLTQCGLSSAGAGYRPLGWQPSGGQAPRFQLRSAGRADGRQQNAGPHRAPSCHPSTSASPRRRSSQTPAVCPGKCPSSGTSAREANPSSARELRGCPSASRTARAER
jgi:hypothetical protein